VAGATGLVMTTAALYELYGQRAALTPA
jgi:hypothetical protein